MSVWTVTRVFTFDRELLAILSTRTPYTRRAFLSIQPVRGRRRAAKSVLMPVGVKRHQNRRFWRGVSSLEIYDELRPLRRPAPRTPSTDHVDGPECLSYTGQGWYLTCVCTCSGCWRTCSGRETKTCEHRRQHGEPDPLQSKISSRRLDHTCV